MTKFYMMVGLPGSGKSTWAKEHQELNNYVILSSDKIREELFGNESSQEDNSRVFQIMNSRAIEFLKNGISVCYDACNISRRSRRNIMSMINFIPEVNKIAVVVSTSISICIKNDEARDRTVGSKVIMKFVNQFELPITGEGFDTIMLLPSTEKLKLDYFNAYYQMKGFNQKNPYHSLNLKEHCEKCQDYVLSRNVDFDILPELAMAALLHDYGKLFTASWDEVNNYNHYYNHENVGAYKLMTEVKFPSWLKLYDIIFYVNYHMIPYVIKKSSEKKKVLYTKEFSKNQFMWDSLNILHAGDENAH